MKTQDKEQQASHTVEIESRILEIMEWELTLYSSYEGSAYIDNDSKKDAVNAIVKFLQPMINELSDLKAHANKGVIVTMEQLNGFTETAKERDELKAEVERLKAEIAESEEVLKQSENHYNSINNAVCNERDELKALNAELLKASEDALQQLRNISSSRCVQLVNAIRKATGQGISIAAITKATKP